MAEWLTTAGVAQRSGRHVVTVRRALERGDLHGHQTGSRGHWRVEAESVDAWTRGRDSREPCCGPRVTHLRPRQNARTA